MLNRWNSSVVCPKPTRSALVEPGQPPPAAEQQKNFKMWVALMVFTTPRKLLRPNSTVLRSRATVCGVCITPRKLNLDMPVGAALSTPAKSKNVGPRSTVETALCTTAPRAMPGPWHINGTDDADDQGFDLALAKHRRQISGDHNHTTDHENRGFHVTFHVRCASIEEHFALPSDTLRTV